MLARLPGGLHSHRPPSGGRTTSTKEWGRPFRSGPVPGYGRGRRPCSKLRRARASASAKAARGSPYTASA
jgi:hypothetical protein